jgi:hypothetical protein
MVWKTMGGLCPYLRLERQIGSNRDIPFGYDQRFALQAGRSGGPGAGGSSPAHVPPDAILLLQNVEPASAEEAAATMVHVDHGDGLVGIEGYGGESDIAAG